MRRERIAALAWTLEDFLPGPKGSSFDPRRQEAPSRREVCPSCDGEGRRTVRERGVSRTVPCVDCGGRLEELDPDSGRVVVRGKRGAGRVDVDSYTGRIVSSHDLPTVARSEEHGCPWCQGSDGGTRRHRRLPRGSGVRAGERCGPCDGSGWIRVTPAPRVDLSRVDADPAPVEAALDRRSELGSYAELERALSAMRVRARDAARLWRGVFVECSLSFDELGPDDRALVGWAWSFIEGRMPREVRVPPGVVGAYRRFRQAGGRPETRDDRMRREYEAGASVAVLARRFGVSTRTVYRAVRRGVLE